MSAAPTTQVIRCLTCRYDLQALSQPRCPECGRAFDPADPMTTDCDARRAILRQRRRRRLLSFLPLGAWLLTCSVMLAIWLFSFHWSRDGYEEVIALTIALATFVRSRVRSRILQRQRDRDRASERSANLALYGFCLFFFLAGGGVRSWSCPHGWGVGAGHLGIANSPNGGPCRNTYEHLTSVHLTGNWYLFVDWPP